MFLPALDVKVQHPSMINKDRKRSICQMNCGLPKNLIQYSAMGLGKGQKFLRIHRYICSACTAATAR